MTQVVTWSDVEDGVRGLHGQIVVATQRSAKCWKAIYGVPTGGSLIGVMLAQRLNMTMLNCSPLDPGALLESHEVLVVDDVLDSGKTIAPFIDAGFDCAVLVNKSEDARFDNVYKGLVGPPSWLSLPWENTNGDPHDAVTRLLQFIGADPNADGLRDTPRRVCDALKERTAGYGVDIADLFKTQFDSPCQEMIVVGDIDFVSTCEHHLMPFIGKAWVGYIPADRGTSVADGYRVIGLSKLARLVDACARKLQMQERMTDEVAKGIEYHLKPLGVGVVVRAKHLCMTTRGPCKQNSETTTSSLLGVFRKDPAVRAEFLSMIMK
jgi:GTP cyclohydrolase I